MIRLPRLFSGISAWCLLALLFSACDSGSAHAETRQPKQKEPVMSAHAIEISAGNVTLAATLEDNPASRALLAKMPFTVTMHNAYGRELVHRYGAGTLPTGTLRSDGYQVGDIVYWPPRGSLVILYAQNGERFERQQLGRISGDAARLVQGDDVEVTFRSAQ